MRLITTVLWLFVAAALSQPCRATYVYIDAYRSGLTMVGTGTTDTNYVMGGQHTAYAKVTVISPSNRSLSNQMSAANRVTTWVYLPLDGEDGLFTAKNEAKEWCPVVRTFFNAALVTDTLEVPAFTYMVSATWSQLSIPVKSGSADLILMAMKSHNCSATQIQLQATFASGDQGLGFEPRGVLGSPSYVGYVATQRFTVATTNGNSVSGSISGVGNILTHFGCPAIGTPVKVATPDLLVR